MELLRGDNGLLVRQGEDVPLHGVRQERGSDAGGPCLQSYAERFEDARKDGGPVRGEGVEGAEVVEAQGGFGRRRVHEGESRRNSGIPERLKEGVCALARLETPLPDIHDLVEGREDVRKLQRDLQAALETTQKGLELADAHLLDVGLVPRLLRARYPNEFEERLDVPRHVNEVFTSEDRYGLSEDGPNEPRPFLHPGDGVRNASEELDEVHLLGRADVSRGYEV